MTHPEDPTQSFGDPPSQPAEPSATSDTASASDSSAPEPAAASEAGGNPGTRRIAGSTGTNARCVRSAGRSGSRGTGTARTPAASDDPDAHVRSGVDRHGNVEVPPASAARGRGSTKPVGTASSGSAAAVAASAGAAASGSAATEQPQQRSSRLRRRHRHLAATPACRPAATGSELAATSAAMAATTAISAAAVRQPRRAKSLRPVIRTAVRGDGPELWTSPLAAFAGLLLVVFGIGVIALGFFALTQGPDIARFIRDNDIKVFGVLISRDTLKSALTPSPGILMFLGALQLIAGAGVMAHKSWGRWLGFLLAVLGLIVSIFAFSIGYAIAGGFTVPVSSASSSSSAMCSSFWR